MNQLLNLLSFNRYPKGPTHKRTDIQTHRKVLHGQYLLLSRNSPNHILSFLTIHCHPNVSIEIFTAQLFSILTPCIDSDRLHHGPTYNLHSWVSTAITMGPKIYYIGNTFLRCIALIQQLTSLATHSSTLMHGSKNLIYWLHIPPL